MNNSNANQCVILYCAAENWAPLLGRAKFNVEPRQAVKLNVVVFCSKKVKHGAHDVYNKIAQLVNDFKTSYVFNSSPLALIETGKVC